MGEGVRNEIYGFNPPLMQTGSPQPTDARQVQAGPFVDLSSGGIDQNGRAPLTGNVATGIEDSARSIPDDFAIRNLNIAAAETADPDAQLGREFLDEGVLSSINWFSADFLAETASDRFPSRGTGHLPQQGLDDHVPSMSPAMGNADRPFASRLTTFPQTPPRDISFNEVIDGSEEYSQSGVEISTRSEISGTTSRFGEFYTDGAGARLPKSGHKPRSWSRVSIEPPEICQFQHRTGHGRKFAFPSIQTSTIRASEDLPIRDRRINAQTFEQILSAFHQYCQTDSPFFSSFESNEFPSAEVLSIFVQNYFMSFQQTYPIFHTPTFHPDREQWLVVLAVAAVGCHMTDFAESSHCVAAFHEFLNRAVSAEVKLSPAPGSSRTT